MASKVAIHVTVPEPGFTSDTAIDFGREIVRLAKAKFPADFGAVQVDIALTNAVVSYAIQSTGYTVGTTAARATLT